jgi:hypothetical protein
MKNIVKHQHHEGSPTHHRSKHSPKNISKLVSVTREGSSDNDEEEEEGGGGGEVEVLDRAKKCEEEWQPKRSLEVTAADGNLLMEDVYAPVNDCGRMLN